MTPTPLEAPLLKSPGLKHGFFTRRGGVSTGVYESLNGGVGSCDAPEKVAENRRRMAAHLAIHPDSLLVPYQTHSPDALIVTEPFSERPRCDALVTVVPGLALGVTGADCGIVLLADMRARVVGAAHAGWKGALTGVLEATLDAMESLGAARASVTAVLGPTIGPKSYEVGAEFFERFVRESKDYASFFAPSGTRREGPATSPHPERREARGSDASGAVCEADAREAGDRREARRAVSRGEGASGFVQHASSFETPTFHVGPARHEHSRADLGKSRVRTAPRDEGEAVEPACGDTRFLFDLPGFIGLRLARAGIGSFVDLALDTYTDAERFYSYRRSVHRGEPDYGRQVAAIALV